MENTLILDSDILIDYLRNKEDVVLFIRNIKNKFDLRTTDINAFELYVGAYKSKHRDKNLSATKGILNNLMPVSTTEDAMEVAAGILVDMERIGKKIEIRDVLISSICIINSFVLLTGNTKHFADIKSLKVISPSSSV